MGVHQAVDAQALTVHPAIGSVAPQFSLTNQHGESVEPIGSGRVLLVFYPAAFSGICTSELEDLREHHAAFDDSGVRLVGVSCDPMFALRVFDDTEMFGFDLLSDFWPHGEVSTAYGCFLPDRGVASRSSFLLDGDGTIRWSVHHGPGEPRPIDLHLAAVAEHFR